MDQIRILIGGQTGDRILETGLLMAKLLARLGLHTHLINDYPSIIKGGHQFVLLRGSADPIGAHSNEADVVFALTQETIDIHQHRFHKDTIIIQMSASKQSNAPKQIIGIDPEEFGLNNKTVEPLRDYVLMSILAGVIGAPWHTVALMNSPDGMKPPKPWEVHIQKGFAAAKTKFQLSRPDNPELSIITGTMAISMGLLSAGLEVYSAYPMTPTSPVLETMAALEKALGLKVILPESEIAVMIMALGCAYMGKRTAVGTSGGGFSLMVEGLGLSGQAELPVVVVYGQRAGPSTGMPTYSAQTDLLFVLSAGHGEFPRFVVAPGDVSEAFYWSGMALNLAWKFQIPAFVLTEKDFCLGAFSFNQRMLPEVIEEQFSNWDGLSTYRRYEINESGVSPQMFPPVPGQVIKTNSYVHDADGITSESPEVAKGIADKRIRKFSSLASELAHIHTVNVSGNGATALLCWGYTKGVCMELARHMKVKVIQPIVLSPFPASAVREALADVTQVITVECNALGQLSILLQQNGFKVDHQVLKYDGRSFSIEELENEIKKVMP